MEEAKKEVKQLLEEIRPHTQYWDCYNDTPLSYNHSNKVALICISKQLELLRYLESKTSNELYRWLVEQKAALKKQ